MLHVQNSHFATNDVPLTFLVLLALTLMVEIVERGRPAAYAAAGAAIGLAVATKFSALPLLLPLAVAAAMRARSDALRQASPRRSDPGVRLRGSRLRLSASRTPSSTPGGGCTTSSSRAGWCGTPA